jgi:hypothetical protein
MYWWMGGWVDWLSGCIGLMVSEWPGDAWLAVISAALSVTNCIEAWICTLIVFSRGRYFRAEICDQLSVIGY